MKLLTIKFLSDFIIQFGQKVSNVDSKGPLFRCPDTITNRTTNGLKSTYSLDFGVLFRYDVNLTYARIN